MVALEVQLLVESAFVVPGGRRPTAIRGLIFVGRGTKQLRTSCFFSDICYPIPLSYL